MYQVGKVSRELIGPQRVMFDFNDNGGILYVTFSSPTQNEIKQFSKDIKVKYIKVGSVFMMLFKFGNLQWMDAPYSPHLSRISRIPELDDNSGLGLQIIFGDSVTGTVHKIRLVGLSNDFSKKFLDDIAQELQRDFSPQFYDLDVVAVMNKYQTEELVAMAKTYCTIRRT